MIFPQIQFQNKLSQIVARRKAIKNYSSPSFSSSLELNQITIDKIEEQKQSRQKGGLRHNRRKSKLSKEDASLEKLGGLPQIKELEQKKNMDKYVQCPICTEYILKHQIMPFSQDCSHFSCNLCLQQHIRQQLKNFKVIGCFDWSCNQNVTQNSKIYKSLMSIQQKQKYYKILIYNSVNKTNNQKLCPNQLCPGFMFIDQKPIQCLVCNQQFCDKCLFNKHSGPCDQNGIKFLEKDLHFKKCDKCKMVVQKNKGCDHITCRCGYQFCYVCGVKWQKNHKCKIVNITQQIPNWREVQRLQMLDSRLRRDRGFIEEPLNYESSFQQFPKRLLLSTRAASRPNLMRLESRPQERSLQIFIAQQTRVQNNQPQERQQQPIRGCLDKCKIHLLKMSVLQLDIAIVLPIILCLFLVFCMLILMEVIFYASIIEIGNRIRNLRGSNCQKFKEIVIIVVLIPVWFQIFLQQFDKYVLPAIKYAYREYNLPLYFYSKVENMN